MVYMCFWLTRVDQAQMKKKKQPFFFLSHSAFASSADKYLENIVMLESGFSETPPAGPEPSQAIWEGMW